MAINRRGIAATVLTLAIVAVPRSVAGGTVEPVSDGTVSVDPARSPDGNYTVMWTVQPNYTTAVLMESINGGAWKDIYAIEPGVFSRAFTGRPPARYSYKTENRQYYYLGVSNVASVLVPSFDVGIIPGSATCPVGSEKITIFMDNQDAMGFPDSSYTPHSWVSGWVGPTHVDGNGNTTFHFCRVDGNQFKPLSTFPDAATEYAVLKLGDECPNGSKDFARFVDNENSENTNWYSGNIYPNEQPGAYLFGRWRSFGTIFRWCLFRYGDDVMTPDPISGSLFPGLGVSYGVFANSGFPYVCAGTEAQQMHGATLSDDEHEPSSNFMISPDVPVDSVYSIVDGYPHSGLDTILRMACVRNE